MTDRRFTDERPDSREERGETDNEQGDPESETAAAYVRRVCGVKGTSDEPAFDENEYVRYLTVGRHKPILPGRRGVRSGDRIDEVL